MEMKLVAFAGKETIFGAVKSAKAGVEIRTYGSTGIMVGDVVYHNDDMDADEMFFNIHKELIIPGPKGSKEYDSLRDFYKSQMDKCKKTIGAIEFERNECVCEDSYYTHSDYDRSVEIEEKNIERYSKLLDEVYYYQNCTQCDRIGNCMGGEIFSCNK